MEPRVSSRDDSHPLEGGGALLFWPRRGFYGVQRAVRGEDAHAHPGEKPRGQADCACLQARGEDETRGEEAARVKAALHSLVRFCSVLGQGINQLHPPSQASQPRRGGILESHCREAPQHREARIQTLPTQLAGLKMAPREKVADYLARAE